MLVLQFSGLNSSFQQLKFVRWLGMGPIKDMVKNDMDRTHDNVGNGYRLSILGDINE